MENSTDQDILVTDTAAAPPLTQAQAQQSPIFNQNNPESSQQTEQKTHDVIEAEQAEFEIPDAPQHEISTSEHVADEPMLSSEQKFAPKIDQLTFDQKKELLNKYDHVPLLKVGTFVDATDTTNNYLLARIVEIDGNQVQVHFDGWSQKWNAWQRINKIQPYRTKNKGYSGQKKIAIRNDFVFSVQELERHYSKVVQLIATDFEGLSAHETIQYLSGELFIFVDSIITESYTDDQILKKVDLFIKSILRLIVAWTNRVSKLQKAFEEIEQLPLLFLVDPHAALIECYPEMMETLNKIFGSCARALHYFNFYDINQVEPSQILTQIIESKDQILQNSFGVVVQNSLSTDFEIKRFDDDTKYTELVNRGLMKDRKDLQYGQLLNWVQYFAFIGGFNALINLLSLGINDEKSVKTPFKIISYLIRPFQNLNLTLKSDFSSQFTTIVSDIIIKRLSTLSEQDVKVCDAREIGSIMKDLDRLLMLGIIASDRHKIIEYTELSIGLRFLKSNFLEKRIKGLTDIRNMIDRINKTQQLATYTKRVSNNWQSQILLDNDLEMSKIQVTGYLTSELMLDWLKKNQILEIIFGQGAHVEIVKRSQPILNFLAKRSNGMLDESVVELIWRCQDGKHEEMIRIVYALIQEVCNNLELEVINMFFAKVSKETRIDEKYLLFLHQFTQIALEKQYNRLDNAWQSQQEEMSENSDQYQNNFDSHLVKQESKFVANLQNNLNIVDHAKESQYGMPIFWDLCQDTSQQPQEIRDLAMKSLLEMFKLGFRKTNRLFYLVLGIQQLLQKKSIVQSTKLVKAVITSYNIDQNQRMHDADEEPLLIQTLQSKIQYLDQVVKLLADYHDQVKQKLKQIDQIQSIEDENSQVIFIGKFSHEKTVKSFLNHIKFILQDQNVALGVKNIQLLWKILVEEPNYQKEQTLFLNWLNRSKADYMTSQKQFFEIFTIEEKKFIFLQILCPAVARPDSNLNLAKCFHTYFIAINKAEGAIKNIIKQFKVTNFSALQGLDELWQISLNSQNLKVRDLCQDLLVNLYLKTQDRNPNLRISFVDNCMKDVNREGVVNLLSLFLNRYEGKKEVKIDIDLARKIQGLKPVLIKVQSWLETEPQVKAVNLTYYQSIGYLRQQIAEVFGVQQNEFIIHLKNQYTLDPEEDDKYMKDFPGQFQAIQIKRQPNYDPSLHPKYLLSDNQEYFDKIFNMLKTSAVSKLDSVYNLFIKLPVNQTLKDSFQSLQKIREAETITARSTAWTELLDPTSTFKLLYCVQIINNLINTDQNQIWLQDFINLGGFNQLIQCLIQLNLSEIDSMLQLKCLKDVIALIQLLIKDNEQLLEQAPRFELMHKLLNQIELICDFSIRSEKQRGYSYENLKKKIDAAHLRKMSNKLLYAANSKDSKKVDDEEDQDSEDKIIQAQLLLEFKDQTDVVNNMFKIVHKLFQIDLQMGIQIICGENSLQNLLMKGFLHTENFILRDAMGCRIFELLDHKTNALNQNVQDLSLHKVKVIIDELKLVSETKSFENRCFEFFKHLSFVISNVNEISVCQQFQDLALQVMNYLSQLIINREIKESNTQELDQLLQGSLILLTNLLQKFPQQKRKIGSNLLQTLLHDCLFEIPHGNKDNNQSAPKCKHEQTRKEALQLVNVLSRDCLENLSIVLNYLCHFNQEATWRTGKESDWNIRLYNDEKSSTGHVGIKNLACICYMNSLNQQLFMIPSFRYDILSIKDPNLANEPDEDNMFLQWQSLFTGLQLSEKMYVNPKSFCHAFKDFDGNPTNVVIQMDAEEYFATLMDRLEDKIKGTPQAKTIQYHFGGEIANEIICKTCPHAYDRKEPFINISLVVRNKKSIYEGFDEFIQGDILDASNQYFCEKCDKKVDALKRTCIKKLPRYLITTFKRFEFDLELMDRIKIQDYYEFPHNLDITKYTQEYLTKKAKGGEFTMKYNTDYYNYELVGIVIHSGTTDSGHYYSYIKEQERFQETQQEKWFEFNDAVVRDFDKNEIPKECFGGMEQSIGWGMKGFMKTANAYLCVYKRKQFDTPVDSDDESNSIQQTQHLGQQTLNLSSDSPIVKKIAKQNHKYWQNRFLFSKEYTNFVCELTAHWNTNFVIPNHSSDRNDDKHLYPVMGTISQQNEPQGQNINGVNDFSLPLDQLYTKEHVESLQFNVFKFAVSHYISIMQRAENKDNLTTMVKYLKSYINFNSKWASWFLQQFINADIIKECLFENTNKFMRQILVGLIYCAMIKTYSQERTFLNNFWIDIRNKTQVIRQTVLGSLILLIVSLLPQLKNYNKNQSAVFQILSRFSFMGPEARTFMIEAQCVEKLLNFFHWECSPYLEEFKNAPRYPFEVNQNPEIGLPTPENLNEKKGRFALIKRTLRQKKLLTDEPHFHYLVETIANLARSIKNQQNKQTKYQIDKLLTQSLGEHDLVLFLPSYEFLEKLFLHSTKPRVIQTLCKAYVHHGQFDDLVFQKLWETVQFGLKEYEHHKIRPFLILFQYMVEAKSEIGQSCDQILNDFFRKVIAQGMRFFQWMEVVFDFVWKMYTRIPYVRIWMQSHIESWEFLEDWLNKNKEPPIQYANATTQSVFRLNKTRGGQINMQRYNKLFNQSLYYYRFSCLNHMKNKTNMDLSAEIDLDAVCVQDFKLENGMKVDMLEDRFNLLTKQVLVCTELDEVVYVEVISDDGIQRHTNWILTTKCKLYQQGIIQSLFKFTEIQRISDVLQKRAEIEEQKRIQLEKEQAKIKEAQEQRSVRGMTKQPQISSVINTAGGNYYYHSKDSDQDEDDDEEDDDMGNKSFDKLPSYEKDQLLKDNNQVSSQQHPQDNYQDYNMGDRSFDKQAVASSSFDKELQQRDINQNQDDVPNLEHNFSYGKPDSTDQNYDAINDDIADFESGGNLSD